MKKSYLTALCVICVFVVSACGNSGDKEPTQSPVEKLESSTDSTSEDVGVSRDSGAYIEYDEISNQLNLSDLSSNTQIANIQLDDTEVIDSYRKVLDGYAVIKSTYAEGVNNAENVNDIIISTGVSDEKSAYEYILYDEQLREKEVVDLKAMLSERLIEEIQEFQPRPVIAPTGQKVAWSTIIGIDVLNISNGDIMSHKLEADDGFSPYEISFIDNSCLGFYRVAGEKIINTRYGNWNLDEDKLHYEEENDYSANQIREAGNYLILGDAENPSTHTSSGKVVTYDCKNNQSKVIRVDNTESTLANITTDGEFLIGYACLNDSLTEHRIRVYSLTDGKVVSEDTFSTDSGVNFYDYINSGNNNLIIGNGDAGKVIHSAFTTR